MGALLALPAWASEPCTWGLLAAVTLLLLTVPAVQGFAQLARALAALAVLTFPVQLLRLGVRHDATRAPAVCSTPRPSRLTL